MTVHLWDFHSVRGEGDLDLDGVVSFADFLLLSSDFGRVAKER